MTRSLSRRWLDVAVDHQQMLHVEAKVNHHQGTGPEKWGTGGFPVANLEEPEEMSKTYIDIFYYKFFSIAIWDQN